MKSLIDISEQDPVNLVLAAEAIWSIERDREREEASSVD